MTSRLLEVFNKYFPEKEARSQQIEAFDFLEATKVKHHIIEAPTGGGKSLIGMAYGLAKKEKFFITTPQKMLQSQYVDTIDEALIGTFYGRSNYKCVWSNDLDEIDCKQGNVPNSPCAGCPYQKARHEALAKKATILNTSLQFNNTYAEKFMERRILVIDEAHSLERVLCDYNMFSITKIRCKQLKIKFPKVKAGELKKFLNFVDHDLIPAIELSIELFKNDNEIIQYMIDCEDAGDEPTVSNTDKRVKAQYDKMCSTLKTATDKFIEGTQQPDLYVLCSMGDTIDMKFKRAHQNFETYINSQYDHVLYMSATFGDLDGFARDLNIKKSDYATLQLDPFFENIGGSFKYIPVRRNNSRMSDKDFTAIILELVNIINKHPGEKGLVHCVNYAQKAVIVDVLEAAGATVITHDNAADKQAALDAFMKYDRQAVFVSPSSTEGLDLFDDLCRYVIFTKVPWLSLGDAWVKERMKDDDWYLRQALTATIQGSGRALRHENDYCTVYYLDDNFDRIIDAMSPWYINQLVRGAS